MIRKISFVAFLTILFSCKSNIQLEGKTYELKNSEQLIKIVFTSKNICEVQQTFYCSSINDSLRNTFIHAKYDLVRSKIEYKKNEKIKYLKVDFLKIQNLNSNYRNSSRYSYIPNYSDLCQVPLVDNSLEMKQRKKISTGVILNLLNDSLVIKKDTIIFGYKKIPIKR